MKTISMLFSIAILIASVVMYAAVDIRIEEIFLQDTSNTFSSVLTLKQSPLFWRYEPYVFMTSCMAGELDSE